MRRLGAIGIIGLGTLFLVSGLSAQELAVIHPEDPADPSAAFMRVYGSTEPPPAFVRFCEEYPEECAATSRAEGRVPASPKLLTELKHYGIADFWTLPTDGRGDCEDYALLKRHELIKLGWPSSALLMTIVSDEKGKGHAVLTARTAEGDFVLDNKVDEVRLWNKAPYRFLLRQSYLNPRVWMDLDPAHDETPLSIAGVGPAH